MIDVHMYEEKDSDSWNRFLITSRNAVFFHHRNYLSYHASRFNECSLIFEKKGRTVGILPATSSGEEVVSHGGLSFAGLLMSKDLRTVDVIEIFDLVKHHYRSLGFRSLIYKAIPYVFHCYPSQEDLYALFRRGAVLVRRDISSCIYLPDRIRFSETKRQLVRKCEAAGVEVNEQSDYTDYWQLLTEVVATHGVVPTHSLEEITLLHERFPENIRLFEARDEGRLLAGVVVFDFKTVVHTQYMANSQEGRERGALDFLINQLIVREFNGRSYLSFGISTEQSGQYLNEGLIQQKELMGARGIVNDFYQLSLV